MSRPAAVDQPVRDAIATDVDQSLVVEAGAGTGKTTVLVERIVSVLRTGRATIDELAVITFTEKAAAELAVRVRQRLEEARRGADPPPPPEERERLDAATADLYRARIETIHAFAANLLRQRPVEAGLDPQFEVLDDLAAGLAFDEHYDAWRGELLSGELLSGEHPELTRALNRGFRLEDLREAAEALHRHRYVLPLEEPRVVTPDVLGFAASLALRARELADLRGTCGVPEEDRGAKQIPAIVRFAGQVADARGEEAQIERLILWGAPTIAKGAGSKSNWRGAEDACGRMKEIADGLAREVEELGTALRTHALVEILPLVEEFATTFEAERLRAGRADFDDLLIWARNLLRDDLGVRRYFQRRYRCLLVDEFQDTDPIQAELVMYLASDADQEAGDWRDLRPLPGKLVVVGDPKQSIYRFRRADIAIYDEVKRGALAGGVREIRQNFRSGPGLLDWVNRVFDHVFEEEPGVQPANTPLLGGEGAELPGLDRSPVVVVEDPGPEDGLSADERRELEAERLAAVARRAVCDDAWPVRDRETGEVRPAQWRDIAVLVPARTGASIYEDALGRAGIPFRHEGGRSFFVRQEVRELVSCLHAVDDPTDRVSVAATLRSPAFGWSDNDLMLFRAGGGVLDYRVPVAEEAGPTPASVLEGLTVLADLHRLRRHASLVELVRRTLERTRMVELALTLPDGAQTAANLLKVVEQARAFSSSGGGGLRGFTRWLSENAESEARESDAGVSEESDDLLRMVTMHSAKGLEYPIVMLANLAGDRPLVEKALPDARARRLHLAVGKRDPGWFETPGFAGAREREKGLEAAERLRLLYVAATRARDHLVIPVVGDRAKANGLLKPLVDFAPGGRDDDGSGCFVYDRALLEGLEPAAGSIEDAVDDFAAAEAQRARSGWAVERDALRSTASRELPYVTATSIEKPWRPLSVAAEDIDGALVTGKGPPLPIGDALHRTMELVSLPGAEDLEDVARAVCEEADLSEHVAEVTQMAQNCLASDVMQRAIRSEKWWREVAFVVPRTGTPSNGDRSRSDTGFTTGRVDLVFRDREGLAVVDYKTEQVSADDVPAALENHRLQADMYARAVSMATELPVGDVVIVFARSGTESTFDCRGGAGIS